MGKRYRKVSYHHTIKNIIMRNKVNYGNSSDTETITKEATQDKVSTEEESNILKAVIIYNDDFNFFNHVVMCIVTYCEHSTQKAIDYTHEIHENGKSNVKEGSYDEMMKIRNILCMNGLSAEVEDV